MAEKEEEQFVDIVGMAEKEQKEEKGKGQDKPEKVLKPEPVADPKLTKKILELMQQLLPQRQIKKGINECLRALTKNEVECVVLAADCDPL